MNKQTIHVIIILSAVFTVFFKVYELDFQHQWDDYWVVINPYTENGFTLENIGDVLTTFFRGQYSPVNEFYYMAIYHFFGYDPLYFHVIGLVIHALNCIILYFLMIRIARQLTGLNHAILTMALFTTLIFACHPINLEAVAFLAASKVLLYAFFYLIGLHFYISYLRSKDLNFLLFSSLFFILSFGAKEQAVTFPIALLILDHCYGRDFSSKRLWWEKVPLFVLALIFGLVTVKSQGDIEVIYNYVPHERLIIAACTFYEYITKCLVPVKLSYIYPFPFWPGDPIPFWLFCYPVAVVAFILNWFVRIIRTKWLFVGIAFFILHIAVSLNLVSLSRHSFIADRYLYISTIGSAFILCYFLLIVREKTIPKVISQGLLIFYISCLAFYTMYHIPVWENSHTLKKGVREIIKSREDYQELIDYYEEK